MIIKLIELLQIPMPAKTKIDLQVHSQDVDFQDGKQMGIYTSVFFGDITDFARHIKDKVFDQYMSHAVVRIGSSKNALQIMVKPITEAESTK